MVLCGGVLSRPRTSHSLGSIFNLHSSCRAIRGPVGRGVGSHWAIFGVGLGVGRNWRIAGVGRGVGAGVAHAAQQEPLAGDPSSPLAAQRAAGSAATQAQVFDGCAFLCHDASSSTQVALGAGVAAQASQQASAAATPAPSTAPQRGGQAAAQAQSLAGWPALCQVPSSRHAVGAEDGASNAQASQQASAPATPPASRASQRGAKADAQAQSFEGASRLCQDALSRQPVGAAVGAR